MVKEETSTVQKNQEKYATTASFSEAHQRDAGKQSSSTTSTCFRRERVATFDKVKGTYCEMLFDTF